MFPLDTLTLRVRAHLADLRRHLREDDGYTTETVVVTALLAILALTVVGIIIAKVTAKANGIDLG
ncbi:hypothetical protein DMH02_009790 [Streptomyces sp. WAC 00631]|uniref:hypothetical protein n=1 Tax=unclassified Streptomyces TaxID=2593676 RepID=UPI000F7B4AC2|nr:MULTISPECIES: hypothetical protein [unclassified Streptomyces]MCC3654015.1 hypothetical protein [Streptomyces sp. S07_1.15]MCC5033500.1 hypothetical protein [Streptomyces sp. WAC 00631]MCC9738526.1 hypothetical protein [Streptomyces sp. MNU89]